MSRVRFAARQYYDPPCRAISVAETDIHAVMHSRDWRAYGASSGPERVMRKTFPTGRAVETSDKTAPEIEELISSILNAQPAPAAPPAPPHRHRQS